MSKPTTPPAKQPLDFKGLDDWFEVLKAGTWTDSKGQVVTFSAADLQEMADNQAKLGKVPSVIGHPKATDPAYAWNTLKHEGGVLYAKSEDINPEFAACVDSGAYRNRSVRVFLDPQHGKRVDHIGWLGAQRPAIPLKALEYQAPEGETHDFSAPVEFSAWIDFDTANGFEDMATFARGIREWLIDDKGLDTADKLAPNYLIENFTRLAARIREEARAEMQREDEEAKANAFSAPKGATVPPVKTYTQAEVDALLASKTAEFSAPANELATLKTQLRDQKIGAQIEAWMKPDAQGVAKLTAADKPGLAEFMAHLDASAPTEFEFSAPGADGKDAKLKKAPLQFFVDFMASRPGGLRLGQIKHSEAPVLDATDTDAISAAAYQFMAAEKQAGRDCTFTMAVTHVSQQSGQA